ncbi:MAG TPA: hypothetical protein VH331_18315 [Allosphingosinicella sp.]|nr:hypothetical protein [Allosphingosinicella sp.]
MSLDALRRLQQAHEELIEALDGQQVEKIEARVEQLRAAIAEVRSAAGWRDLPDAQESAQQIRRLGEAARIRVNFLTDRTAQRLQMLASARGDALGVPYTRRRVRQTA